jgi:Zn-dependent protease
MTTSTALMTCERCGNVVASGMLRCPNCGEFTHRSTLERMSADALSREQADPLGAAGVWQQSLALIPPDAPQYGQVRERIGILVQRAGGAVPTDHRQRPPAAKKDDPVPLALVKTVGSMLISIAIYTAFFGGGWQFATGFVLLILVHELGHVAAMRYYGLSASPPIFIPFVGALINLREPPKNAMEEAVVGIAGPVAGTIGAAVCLAWGVTWNQHQDLFILLAHFGFMLNLFNMLPVPPLDGGRVTAAVSPWLWMPGILALVAWIAYEFVTTRRLPWMLLILLMYAWPRVWATLKGRQRQHPYYQIGRLASVSMGAAYLILGVALVVLFVLTIPIAEATILSSL